MTIGMVKTRSGFTLIELLIVMMLLGMLAAMSWPALENEITSSELPESVDHFRDLLYMTRAEAVNEHRRHRIRFEPGKQMPIIEVEPQPIREPNIWEPVKSDWAKERILMAEIQVHEIRLGRPIYMIPVSRSENMEDLEEFLEQEEEAAEEGFVDAGEFSGPAQEDEVEFDEKRPSIVFQPDGTAEWATIIVTVTPLNKALEEDHEQMWIQLDGRTGLATIREPVTQEQLDDPEFFVDRDKLELPDQPIDPDDPTSANTLAPAAGMIPFGSPAGSADLFSALNGAAGNRAGAGGDGRGGRGGDGLSESEQEEGERGPSLTSDESDGGRVGGAGGGNTGFTGDGSGRPGVDGLPQSLEEGLRQSGLSEAEQENIRNSLGGRGN